MYTLASLLLAVLCGAGGSLAAFSFSQQDYDAYLRARDLQLLEDEELYYGTFPAGFSWSSATSSHQIEGAWDADGKGENIWDRFSHEGGNIEDGHTGDVACNSYYQYQDDIALLQNLGVSQYRFSISWARIQPTGQETTPNAAGVQYYNNLIDGLLAAGITPVATLYHWDLPQALEDQGGWLNEDLVVDAFATYSRICFQEFGDRVKWWITLNEPWVIAYAGYGTGGMAPGVEGIGDLVYIAGHSLIKAHAEAYHVYNDEFRAVQNGQISITVSIGWSEPRNRSVASDVDAAMRNLEFEGGWFVNPIFVNGDYPDVMKYHVAQNSYLQGYNVSRLPTFSEAEQQRIVGTHDFFGLNHYSSSYIFHEDKPLFPPSYDSDKAVGVEYDPDWPTSGSSWLYVTPFGMRKILAYIDSKYGHPRILITENGMSDRNDSLVDDHRIYFYKYYINNVLQAIDLDGVDVMGYTAWTLMDNFEWATGYNENFGLYHVNFTDPARPRILKASVDYYKQLIIDHGYPPPTNASSTSL